jgi:antitoxin (DNA-binding transcriptional repressor) of toxin-antitoxin stability system
MITHVTLVEATANIVQLLERVINGEEIIIFQSGQPIAHISPAKSDRQPRIPGQYAGRFIVPASFNDPLPDDIIDGFLDPADLH